MKWIKIIPFCCEYIWNKGRQILQQLTTFCGRYYKYNFGMFVKYWGSRAICCFNCELIAILAQTLSVTDRQTHIILIQPLPTCGLAEESYKHRNKLYVRF